MHEDLIECPNDCGTYMQQHWDNTGGTPPEGVPHYEVDYYYCPKCGFKVDDLEELEAENE